MDVIRDPQDIIGKTKESKSSLKPRQPRMTTTSPFIVEKGRV